MNSPAKLVAALFVAFIFTISPSYLFAQSMHGEPELDAAVPYSEPYAGQALWMVREYQGIQQSLSAVRINQCWGVTAGHAFLSSGFVFNNHVVGNSSNYMGLGEPGQTRVVSEHHLHPTWEAGNGFWNGHRLDLAVIRFAQPLAGQNLEIGSLSLGEVFEYVGFGRPALPGVDDPPLPVDGERRAFDVGAHEWGNGVGTISTNYVRSRFTPLGHYLHLPMGGIATGGGSGSGGYNAAGDLVSLLVYQTSSPSYMGSSYGLRLDRPEVKDWIESYTNNLSCIPPRPTPVPFGKASVWALEAKLSLCQDGEIC